MMLKGDDPYNRVHQSPPTPRWARYSLVLNAVVLAILLRVVSHSVIPFSFPVRLSLAPLSSPSAKPPSAPPPPPPEPILHPCSAPLPPFLESQAPSGAEPPLREALDRLDAVLKSEFGKGGIDSLSVAVVGSEGSIYEGFWGRLRANESAFGQGATVDRHSIYRLASVSKLFTAMETLILRDADVIQLDDPISLWCREFEYNSYYAPITLRALMTHMSGIGRDLPPGNAQGHWPKSLLGRGPPKYNGLEFPSRKQVFDAVANSRPVTPPWRYPVYSNTGYGLLGMANVAANAVRHGSRAPLTHAELVRQDIFEPLGLNGSSFLITKDNIDNVVVSSVYPEEVDLDFLDATNPSGGQLSSLSDLIKVMRVLINPRRPESLLSPHTVNEWLRPAHAWFDDYSSVGALWEIYTSTDSYGRKQKLYQKIGALAGHHTAFTLNPVNSYGIIVLQSGLTSETIRLTKLITNHVQVAFDRALEDVVRADLGGTWRSADGSATLTVEIDQGSLYVSDYTINDTDVLRVVQDDSPWAATRLPLWPGGKGEGDEYRIVVPAASDGCLFSWIWLDLYGYVDGTAANVVAVRTGARGERVLFLPAVNAELLRDETPAA